MYFCYECGDCGEIDVEDDLYEYCYCHRCVLNGVASSVE